MKDIKFVVLLFLITILGLTSIIWLVHLQIKISHISGTGTEHIPTQTEITSPAYIQDLTVRHLQIVNKQLEGRIDMIADGNEAFFSIIDDKNKERVSIFTFGPNKSAGLVLRQPLYNENSDANAGIALATNKEGTMSYPRIELNDIYGNETRIYGGAIISPEIREVKGPVNEISNQTIKDTNENKINTETKGIRLEDRVAQLEKQVKILFVDSLYNRENIMQIWEGEMAIIDYLPPFPGYKKEGALGKYQSPLSFGYPLPKGDRPYRPFRSKEKKAWKEFIDRAEMLEDPCDIKSQTQE
jgi:hypothetical protein